MSNSEHLDTELVRPTDIVYTMEDQDVIRCVEANLRAHVLRVDTRGFRGNETGEIVDEDGEIKGDKGAYISPLRLSQYDSTETSEFVGLRAGYRDIYASPAAVPKATEAPAPKKRRFGFGKRTQPETAVVSPQPSIPPKRVALRATDVVTGQSVPFSSLSYSINANQLKSGENMLPRSQRLVLDGHVPSQAGEAFLKLAAQNPQLVRQVFSSLRDYALETPFWKDSSWHEIGYDKLPNDSKIILGSVSLQGDRQMTTVTAGPYSKWPRVDSDRSWPKSDPESDADALGGWPTTEQP
jgi:hypothetical protein